MELLLGEGGGIYQGGPKLKFSPKIFANIFRNVFVKIYTLKKSPPGAPSKNRFLNHNNHTVGLYLKHKNVINMPPVSLYYEPSLCGWGDGRGAYK